jgi:hypothetical protein
MFLATKKELNKNILNERELKTMKKLALKYNFQLTEYV